MSSTNKIKKASNIIGLALALPIQIVTNTIFETFKLVQKIVTLVLATALLTAAASLIIAFSPFIGMGFGIYLAGIQSNDSEVEAENTEAKEENNNINRAKAGAVGFFLAPIVLSIFVPLLLPITYLMIAADIVIDTPGKILNILLTPFTTIAQSIKNMNNLYNDREINTGVALMPSVYEKRYLELEEEFCEPLFLIRKFRYINDLEGKLKNTEQLEIFKQAYISSYLSLPDRLNSFIPDKTPKIPQEENGGYVYYAFRP